MNIRILPTVLVKDRLALEERLELYEGLVDRVQLDIVDGEFSVEPSLGVEVMVEQITSLKREVHLMVSEPIDWLELCSEEGVELVAGQIEVMGNQKEFVEKAKQLSLKVGLGVDLETDLKELDWSAAKECDQILIMTVRAGEEKEKLDKRGLEKVESLRKKDFKGEICVDGGVNEETIKQCVKAGADVLAVGRGLWQAKEVKEQYKKLLEIVRKLD